MNAAVLSDHPHRLFFAGIFAVSAGAIGTALFAEQLGVVPCLLCIYQRVPYVLTAMIAAGGFLLKPSPAWQRVLIFLIVGVFVGGAVLAAYHVGVENHWWAAPAGCGGQIPTADSLSAVLNGEALARRACDQDVWRLLGVSLAGWNVLTSMIFALGCYAGARVLLPRRTS